MCKMNFNVTDYSGYRSYSSIEILIPPVGYNYLKGGSKNFVGYEVTKATAGYIRLLISKNICTHNIYGYWLRGYKGYCWLQ